MATVIESTICVQLVIQVIQNLLLKMYVLTGKGAETQRSDKKPSLAFCTISNKITHQNC